MTPTLQSGDAIFVDKFSEISENQIVVFSSPVAALRLVKRITAVRKLEEISMFWVEGDNKETSVDSRNFGEINSHLVQGRARAIIFPPWRARLL